MRNGLPRLGLLPLALLALLAGCRGGQPAANGSAAAAAGTPVQTDTLTGLYEGGGGARRNQLCMIERGDGVTGFGFVTWSSGEANCSGVGTAVREGDRLRLHLDGSQSCVLEARIGNRHVTFPARIPAACQAYYCGPGAQLTGAEFDKVGGTREDAVRAVDLAGEPLCGS